MSMGYYSLDIDEEDLSFYKFFDVKPKIYLSDCQFYNMYKFGYCIGSDICPAVDDDSMKCEDCNRHKQENEYYPKIEDYVLIQLLIELWSGKPDVNYTKDIKYDLLQYFMDICKNDKSKYGVAQTILNNYVEEYGRR